MAQHNLIDVRKQKKLSLGRSLKICLRGMTHRLLRSSLTLAVVVLAVGFFMTLLTENVFIASTAEGVGKEVTLQREASVTLNFLSVSTSFIPSTHSEYMLRRKAQLAATIVIDVIP